MQNRVNRSVSVVKLAISRIQENRAADRPECETKAIAGLKLAIRPPTALGASIELSI